MHWLLIVHLKRARILHYLLVTYIKKKYSVFNGALLISTGYNILQWRAPHIIGKQSIVINNNILKCWINLLISILIELSECHNQSKLIYLVFIFIQPLIVIEQLSEQK